MITFYYTIDADSDYPWLMPPDVQYMLPASSWATMRPVFPVDLESEEEAA